jgi:hypothetical protein
MKPRRKFFTARATSPHQDLCAAIRRIELQSRADYKRTVRGRNARAKEAEYEKREKPRQDHADVLLSVLVRERSKTPRDMFAKIKLYETDTERFSQAHVRGELSLIASIVRDAKAMMGGGAQEDTALFALYRQFATVIRKVDELGANEAAGGSGSSSEATPEQRAVHMKWERALDRAGKLADKIIAAPARTVDGMLLKIQVVGFHLIDSATANFKPLINAPDWQREEKDSPYAMDALIALRADMQRMRAKGGVK